jgi:hypothetical protein
MPTLDDIRTQNPEYKDVPDQVLADRVHQIYYPDVPKDKVYERLGFAPKIAAPTPQTPPMPQPVTPTMTKGEMRLPGSTGEQPVDTLAQFVKGPQAQPQPMTVSPATPQPPPVPFDATSATVAGLFNQPALPPAPEVPGYISPRAKAGITQDMINAPPPPPRETIRAEKMAGPRPGEQLWDHPDITSTPWEYIKHDVWQNGLKRFGTNVKIGAQSGTSQFYDKFAANLVFVTNKAQEYLGGDPEALGKVESYLRKVAAGTAPDPAEVKQFSSFTDQFVQALGAAPYQIAVYAPMVTAAGPVAGFALADALMSADKGWAGAGKALVEGAGMGYMLGGVGHLSIVPRAVALAAAGAAATGGGVRERALGGLTLAALGLHGKGRVGFAEAAKNAVESFKGPWEKNQSVHHFQKQGFEFKQAKSPQEVEDLQGKGYQRTDLAPDLWFKAKGAEPGKEIGPRIYEEQPGGYWRVQGSEDAFNSRELAEEAAGKMGKPSPTAPAAEAKGEAKGAPEVPGEGVTPAPEVIRPPGGEGAPTPTITPPSKVQQAASGEVVPEKKAWQMNSNEFFERQGINRRKASGQKVNNTIKLHERIIETAAKEGKQIPDAVLEEYPFIARDYFGWEVKSPEFRPTATKPVAPEAKPPVEAGGVKEPKLRGIDKAVEHYDLPTIIRLRGGIDPRSKDVIGNFEPEELQYLRLHVFRKGGTGPDVMFDTLKKEYPDQFGHFKDSSDMMSALVDGRAKRVLNRLGIEKTAEEYYARIEEQRIRDGLDEEGLTRVERVIEREMEAEEIAGRSAKPGGYDTSWDITPRKTPTSKLESRLDQIQTDYPGADREKVAQVIRALPNAEDGQIVNMAVDPEMFKQVARGNLTALERAQLLKKATDVGAQQVIPGMEGKEFDHLKTEKEVARGKLFDTPTPKAGEGKMYGSPIDTEDIVRLATPGLEAGKSTKRGIQSLLLPGASSPLHLTSAEVLGNYLGSKFRDSNNQAITLRKDKRMFDKLGVNNPKIPFDENIGMEVMSALSTGRDLDPRFQGYATKRAKLFDYLLKALEAAGVPLEKVRENYFEGMWEVKSVKAYHTAMEEAKAAGIGKDVADVNDWRAQDKAWVFDRVKELLKSGDYGEDKSALSYLTKRPLAGKESFRKAKTFNDIFTGMEFGLEPISYNPVILDLLKMEEMGRSLMAARAFKEFRELGLERPITATEMVPEGWSKISDKYGTIWGGTSVPVWKMLQELAKSAKKDLYFAKFGKDVFADPALKEELKNFGDLHQRKVGQKKSYSQVLMEKLLENPTDFQEKAPGIYAKLQDIADNNPKLKEILGTPEFTNLQQKLPVGGKIIKGYHIFKNPTADILNNYYSSSLYNSPYFGTAYKGLMAAGNSLNQFQLMGWFHAGFTTFETQITAGSEVIKDIYGLARGNRTVGQLGKTLAKFSVATINTAREGSKILAEWNNPQMDVPTNVPVGTLPTTKEHRIAQIAKSVELGGGKFDMDMGLRTFQSEAMRRDWYGGKPGKAVLRSPIALTEAFMWPTMKFLVPRQKAGVNGEIIGRIIEQNPNRTLAELRPQFRQAVNRVDARLGQVGYDRLFINNAAKNVMQLLVRAPGWTGGTLAEIGGAPKDLAKFVDEWVKTGKAPENIPDRVAYTLSLLGTMVVANGLMTYLFTGERPHGMDWWAFRDGGKDDKGNPTRLLFPTYMKDLHAWFKDWKHTASAKMHPLLSLGSEINRNRDYYNNMLFDEEKGRFHPDSLKLQGKHLIKGYIPFWIRGAAQIAERGGGLKETLAEHPGKLIAPQFGIMPATRAYTQTNLDEVINRYNRVQITRTPEQGEETKLRREAQALIRMGKPEKATKMLQEAVASKKIDPEKAIKWQEEGEKPAKTVQFKNLPLEWQAKALLKATPEEEKLLMPLFEDKRDNATDKAIDKAAPQLKQLYEMWKNRGKVKVSLPAAPPAKEDDEENEPEED